MDNSHLESKLELRRHFLRQIKEPLRVMDCFQGDGVIWNHLKSEFELESYWGLDLEIKKGRLKIDSSRVLSQPGWSENVIDLDAYGSPWKHYIAMLPNIRDWVVVFLTFSIGKLVFSIDQIQLDMLGVSHLNIPPGIKNKLTKYAVSHCLTKSYDFCIIPIEVKEAIPFGNCRYIGLRLERIKQNGRFDNCVDGKHF